MPKGQFTLSDEAKMILMARSQVYKWLRIHKTITGKTMKLGNLDNKGPERRGAEHKGPGRPKKLK